MDYNNNPLGTNATNIPNWDRPWINNQPPTPIPTFAPVPNVTLPKQQVKMIKSIDDVYPNEIPSDGSWGIFILEDLSKVYLLSNTIEGIKRNEYCLKEDISVKLDENKIASMIADNNEILRQEMSRMISNAFKRNNHKPKGGMGNE